MSLPNLKVAVENRIATLSIDHPPANALNRAVLEELHAALTALEQNDEVKVVILTGEGRFFVAGADIKEFTGISGAEAAAMAEAGQGLFNRIEAFPKPVIAAVNGACLGGGLELAMACHIRLAAAEAKLGLPELNLGLIPGYGGTQRLPRLVGRGRATELILTSRMVTGVEAKRIGLADEVYPQEELLVQARELAQKIAEKGKVAIRLALSAIHTGFAEGFKEGLAQEAALFGEAFETEDMKEGVAAFLEKRKPQFTDR
ncbi:enoyl-CoA hydratase [Brevibacillus sp. B_LB10_24]|uniref:enoyl-CoA hydratase n=1 Tax=Brevibacillus sp. B_LB10_24 TaxID=3380645 RepID=UPI0038BDED21